jgi:hypothetical protein
MTGLGLNTVSWDWLLGVTDDTLFNPITNADYGDPGEPMFLPGDKSIKCRKTTDSLRNWFLFEALLNNDNSTLGLTRYLVDSTGEDTYKIGKGSDVKYVARYLKDKIQTKISTSVATISTNTAAMIAKYDQRFTDNGLGGKLICIINETDIRAFDIAGTQITLKDPDTGVVSPIATLAVNDTFELINCFDVMEEGKDEADYPTLGYVKKHAKPGIDDCSVWFNKYDKPMKVKTEKVIIYYNSLTDYAPEYPFNFSYTKHYLSSYEVKLDFPTTEGQLVSILFSSLANYSNEKVEIILKTRRPTLAKKGWIIDFDVTDMYTGTLFVVGVDFDYIYPDSSKPDTPIIEQTVTFSNYPEKETLSKVLSGLKRKGKINKNTTLSSQLKSVLDAPVPYVCKDLYADRVTIQWLAVTGATKYYITVWDSITGAIVSGFNDLDVGNVLEKTVTGLTANTGYRHKVRAWNATAGYSAYSQVYSFASSTTIYGFIYYSKYNNSTSKYDIWKIKHDGTDNQLVKAAGTYSLKTLIAIDPTETYLFGQSGPQSGKDKGFLYNISTGSITYTNTVQPENPIQGVSGAFSADSSRILRSFSTHYGGVIAFLVSNLEGAFVSIMGGYNYSKGVDVRDTLIVQFEYYTGGNVGYLITGNVNTSCSSVATNQNTILNTPHAYALNCKINPLYDVIGYSSQIVGGIYQLFIIGINGNDITQITFGGSSKFFCGWDYSGTRMLYYDNSTGVNELYYYDTVLSQSVQITNNGVNSLFGIWCKL